MIFLRKLFKNEEGRDSNTIAEGDKPSSSREGRDNDLARLRAQMAARRAAKAIPTPVPSTREQTPAPSAREPTPPPPHEATPAPSARNLTPPPPTHEATPVPTAPAPKPNPIPARDSTLLPSATLPARLSRPHHLPARVESHALSDLTDAESNEDSEPIQIAPKGKAKKVSLEPVFVLNLTILIRRLAVQQSARRLHLRLHEKVQESSCVYCLLLMHHISAFPVFFNVLTFICSLSNATELLYIDLLVDFSYSSLAYPH